MRNNLIMNSNWCQVDNGGPLHFSGSGPITFDRFCLNGCRSCSVTMTGQNGMQVAVDAYDPPIKVTGMCEMEWGYIIRAIEATQISLIADFYDVSGNLIQSVRCRITDRVSECFTRQMAHFKIPCDAENVMLSMEFNGAVTACTFLAPCAYFCCDCQQ